MNINAFNQLMTDKLAPYPFFRWLFLSVLILFYILKIVFTGTHHLITYCAAVYLFHGFILFATPKDDTIPDPFEMDKDDIDEPESLANIGDNFRPFIRNLPEYSYWLFCLKVIFVSFILTLTAFTNIPVCTPILLIYFIFMVAATLVKLWNHANRYRYNPFWQTNNLNKE